jgi:hypothetical protein
MIKITSLSVTGALLAFGFSAAPAQAGPNRTWVSGHGTDSGGCPVTAPCRTFAFALTQTAAGGEIDVLEPAGYGPVTITKSISIVNDGVGTAAIGVESGNAITINASGLFDFVHLRGLTIEGHPGFGVSVGNGIQFNSGLNLAIENWVIRKRFRDKYLAQHGEQLLGVEYDCFQHWHRDRYRAQRTGGRYRRA